MSPGDGDGVSNPAAPRIRVAAVVLRGDRLLLVNHAKDGRSYWLLPGGGVDFGETLVEALAREVREETGFDVRPGSVVLVCDSIPPDRHRHIVNVIFTAEVVGGSLRAVPDDARVAGVEFVPLDRVPDLSFYPDIREILLAELGAGFPHRLAYRSIPWR